VLLAWITWLSEVVVQVEMVPTVEVEVVADLEQVQHYL
jgi:hypothetical protein